MVRVMFFFVIVLMMSFLPSCMALNILVMGNSLDRNFIIDWCYMKRVQGVNVIRDFEWGKNRTNPYEPYLGYIQKSYWMCQTANHSIAHSHFFGSRSHGPYYQPVRGQRHSNTSSIHSVTRMQSTYDLYEGMFEWGAPDRIILAFAIWDLSQFLLESSPVPNNVPIRNSVNWNKICDEYRTNMRDRIMQAQGLFQNSSKSNAKDGQVWLRTIPFNKRYNYIGEEYNRITIELATEFNLGYFDLDKFIWPPKNTIVTATAISQEQKENQEQNYEVIQLDKYNPNADERNYVTHFQDDIHPKPAYNAMAAEALLQESYSTYLIPPLQAQTTQGNNTDIDINIEKTDPRPYNFNTQYTASAGSMSAWDYGLDVYLVSEGASMDHSKKWSPSQGGANITTMEDVVQHAWFYDKSQGVRYNGLTVKFLELVKLNPGHVYKMPKEMFEKIPIAKDDILPVDALDSCHLVRVTEPEALAGASNSSIGSIDVGASEHKHDHNLGTYYLHYMQAYLRHIDDTTILHRLLPLLHPELAFKHFAKHDAKGEGNGDSPQVVPPPQAAIRHMRTRRTHTTKKLDGLGLGPDELSQNSHTQCSHFPSKWLKVLPYGTTVWYDYSREKDNAVIEVYEWINPFKFLMSIPAQYMFDHDTKFLLRIDKQAQVFLISKGERVPVMSLQDMYDLGRDFDQVLKVTIDEMIGVCKLFACSGGWGYVSHVVPHV